MIACLIRLGQEVAGRNGGNFLTGICQSIRGNEEASSGATPASDWCYYDTSQKTRSARAVYNPGAFYDFQLPSGVLVSRFCVRR